MKADTRKKKIQTLEMAVLMMPYVLDTTGAWEPVREAILLPIKEFDRPIPPTLLLTAEAIIKMAEKKLEAVHLTPNDVRLATTGIDCNKLYRYRAISRYEEALEQEDDEKKDELYKCFGAHPDKHLYR